MWSSIGFPSATFHLTLEMAAAIDGSLYNVLSLHRGYALGDWLFSLDAFRE